MKKATLVIVFALVAILSMSFVPASADVWSEDEVISVMGDFSALFPAMFADEEEGYMFEDFSIWEGRPTPTAAPTTTSAEAAESKALIHVNGTQIVVDKFTANFDPCGEGKIDFDLTFFREEYGAPAYQDDYNLTYTSGDDIYRGSKQKTYIRSMEADVTVDGTSITGLSVSDCKSTGGSSCHAVYFDANGKARIKGSVLVPDTVMFEGSTVELVLKIKHSAYKTVLWDINGTEDDIDWKETAPITVTESKNNFCQASLEPIALGYLPAIRARYDENTGEARFQITLANKYSNVRKNYAIPAEIRVGDFDAAGLMVDGKNYKKYICKATIFNTETGAPKTDYCEYGKGVALAPNEIVRFDITIPHIEGAHTDDIPFYFRVGGMNTLVNGTVSPIAHPCAPVTKMDVMDPVLPFLHFYLDEDDNAIEPSGPYNVYEGGAWGIYEKCGKEAFIITRLKNSGTQAELVDLSHVAVAINGGTPMKFRWIISTVPTGMNKNVIELEPGQSVALIGRAKVTEMPSQLNSDVEMTVAVNWLDYGLYTTGKLFSDHNNTRCVPPVMP